MNDESVAQEAHRICRSARGEAYGHPLDDYTRVAGQVNALFAHKLREPLTAEDMQVVMICVKLSRQVNCPRRDNLVDICGYADCIDRTIAERGRRNGGEVPIGGPGDLLN